MKSLILSALIAVVPAAAYAAPPVVSSPPQPVQTYDRDRPAYAHERYDRFSDSRWSRDYHGRWRMLGGYIDARNDRQAINVGGARIHKLRIEAVRGEPRIERLTLVFGDGSREDIEINERLDRRGAGEFVDLDNVGDRRIRRLIVHSAPDTRGVFAVYAG
jgi:hypothetical protein